MHFESVWHYHRKATLAVVVVVVVVVGGLSECVNILDSPMILVLVLELSNLMLGSCLMFGFWEFYDFGIYGFCVSSGFAELWIWGDLGTFPHSPSIQLYIYIDIYIYIYV